MQLRGILYLGSALAVLSASQAGAQSTAISTMQAGDTIAEQQQAVPGETIVVSGERLRGQLDVDQAPVLELNEADIQAIGATSVADLISAISSQTGSSRGRGGGQPVFLVNGIRIGSFREMRSYPPEAIAKVEVLPEEVAQRFGFPPDRRVVNMILKDNFSSREVELEYEQPSRGNSTRNEQEATLLTINDGARLNLNLERFDRSILTEAERHVTQEPGSVSDVTGDPDPGAFRSLLPGQKGIEATVNWATAIIDSGSSISLNATYEREESRTLAGLNSVALTGPGGDSAIRTFGARTPLERNTASDTFSAAGSYTRPLGNFQLTATADASLADGTTLIDRRFDTLALRNAAAAGTLALDAPLPEDAGNGFDTARTRLWGSQAKATLRGTPFNLPAGEFSTTFDIGYNWSRIESSDTRTAIDTRLTRGDIEGGVNIVIPITSRRDMVWDALGSISLNGQAGFNHLSDFGTLYDWSAGLNWSPWDNLDLQATYVWTEVAPSLGNLGNPRVENLNVQTFDFVRGETVLATIVSGGNPDLQAETQRDWKFTANWELPFWKDTRLSAEYVRNRSSDVTSAFPVLTSAIEAAFPDRVERDASGRLLSIDRRPVTFARTRSNRLVLGLVTRGSFGEARPQASAGGPEGAGAGDAGGPRFAGRGPGAGAAMPSEEQRAAFMRFRERICAEGGIDVLRRFAEAAAKGEDLTQEFPGFDPERAAGMVERLRGPDGTIDQDQLAQLRERMCSFDPAAFGRGGPGGSPPAGAGPGGPAGGAAGGPRGGGRGGFGNDGRGRYFLNLTHTIELDNSILIANGGPQLDLLDGDAIGDEGLQRHATRMEGGLFRNGLGLRLSGTYTGKTRIDGSGLPGSSALHFGDLVKIDLRVFLELGQMLKQEHGLLKNLRVSLRADNLFDARRRVTDANGEVPLRYQPFLIDPTGRYLGIDLRKLF